MITSYKIDIKQPATPVQQQERAQILDVLRGLAILGILLNNIYGFSGYMFLTEEMRQQFSTYRADSILNFLQIVLIEGKFYSLFSLLFGIGFSIILIRGEQKGTNALKIFYRRLIVLMLIGAAHLYFFWEGDILFLYAFLGLFLPLFRKCADRTLLMLAALFILSPIVIDAIKLLLQGTPAYFLENIGRPIEDRNGITDDNWRGFLFTPKNGWDNWRSWQESAWTHRFYGLLDSNRLPKVFGMFLIGFYAGRKMIYIKLEAYKPLFKKIMFWGFVIGIPFSVAMANFEGDEKYIFKSPWGMADTITYAFAVAPLSLAYASAVCLLWVKTKWLSNLKVFAPVGRMALTSVRIS